VSVHECNKRNRGKISLVIKDENSNFMRKLKTNKTLAATILENIHLIIEVGT